MNHKRRIRFGTRLDGLFERWEATYTPAERADFHRDGAMNEATYYAEPRRVLVVQVEPNSRDGNYDRFRGHDLRLVFPQLLTKPNTVHMAMFAVMALDGRAPAERFGPDIVHTHLDRFACINIKKICGSGAAKKANVAPYAWRDREFFREQVRILEPHVILAGGPIVWSLLGKALLDQDSWKPSGDVWQWETVSVIRTHHPSVRPYLFREGMAQLATRLGLLTDSAT